MDGGGPGFGNESAYEIINRWAQQSKIPLLVPFEQPKGSGVLAGIVTPSAATAEKVRQLVQALLGGEEPTETLLSPDNIQLTLDQGAADVLGLRLSQAAIKAATKVHER